MATALWNLQKADRKEEDTPDDGRQTPMSGVEVAVNRIHWCGRLAVTTAELSLGSIRGSLKPYSSKHQNPP